VAADWKRAAGRFAGKRAVEVIRSLPRCALVAITLALVAAGCGRAAPVAELPGPKWQHVHDRVDVLCAADRPEAAARSVARVRAEPGLPAWLAEDLAATEASLHQRARLAPEVRDRLRQADEGELRLADLTAHDSLSSAYAIAHSATATQFEVFGARDPRVRQACMRLSVVAFEMGRSGEADSLARAVLASLPAGADTTHPLAADAEQMIGRVIKNFSGARLRDEAMAHYQRALGIRERTDGPRSLAVADLYQDIGNLERSAKRYPAAVDFLRRALAIQRARLGPRDERVASTLGSIAWLSASQGDWKGAERSIRQSLSAVPESALRSPSTRALRIGLLGQALRRTGHIREAIVALRSAVAAAESGWVRVPHDGSGSVSAGLSIHRELALALAAEGRAEEAFEHVERSQLRLWARDLPDQAWPGVLRRVQRALPRDAAMVLWPRTAIVPPGGDYPMWGCVVRNTGRPVWVRIERTPGWSATGIAPREALNRELVHAFEWPLRVTDTRRVDSLAALLGRELLTPLEPHLQGVTRLIVSGPDLMAWTPLGMMRDARGVRLDERFAISYVPSGLAFADLSERDAGATVARADHALLFGAPEPGSADASRWPPLTGAAGELHDLAGLFPDATVLMGKNATAARLDAMARSGALDRFGVVHLAAHIDLNPARVLQSAFVLAPDLPGDPNGSRLPAGRVAQWQIHGLVSLAACRSALGVYSASEGYLGMHSAFLAAGAPCVLVSLWQVDDDATRRLMREFHTRLLARGGANGAAQALRAAQRAVREYRAPDGRTPFAHPIYWAGFALVGKG
jgi:CHAT domain-containing protein/tetratricopeptide (TPR) repeat protein